MSSPTDPTRPESSSPEHTNPSTIGATGQPSTWGPRPRLHRARTFPTLVAVAAAVLLNVPLLGALITSLKPRGDIAAGPLSIPSSLTLDNYRSVLGLSEYNFQAYIINSLAISLGTVILILLLTYPAAFAIARLGFGGTRLLQAISALRLLPAIFFVIPFFLLFTQVRLLDTLLGLIIANTFAHMPLGLLLLVGAFRDLPAEIEEAALIDGCGLVKLLTTVCAPMIAPTLVAVSLLSFLFSWSEYLFAVILSTTRATPITVGAANFITSYEIRWGQVSAAAVISILPPMILSIVLQRYLVSGLTSGAIKG